MKKTTKIFATLAVCSALCQPAMSAEEKTKIGLITTLSGGGAGLGIDIRDAFQLAIEQSEKKNNIEVFIEDDQSKPNIGIRVADEMIQSKKVDILTGIVFSNVAMAVVPAAVRQNKFYISANAAPSALAGKGCHKNYFSASWQNDNQHEAAGAYANDVGYKNTLILVTNYPAGIDGLNGYKRLYKGNVAAELKTKFGQTDYAAEIAQIRASGADSVYIFLPGGMGISFLKQYADSGVDKPLMGAGFVFDQTILPAVGEAAAGVVNTSQWGKDLDNPTNKQFVASFQKKYNRLPSVYASQAYDTANLIISALDKAPVSDADAFRAALKAADFDSVRSNFKFGDNHHPIQDFYAREVVKENGTYTNKILSKVLTNHSDAYAADCKMK